MDKLFYRWKNKLLEGFFAPIYTKIFFMTFVELKMLSRLWPNCVFILEFILYFVYFLTFGKIVPVAHKVSTNLTRFVHNKFKLDLYFLILDCVVGLTCQPLHAWVNRLLLAFVRNNISVSSTIISCTFTLQVLCRSHLLLHAGVLNLLQPEAHLWSSANFSAPPDGCTPPDHVKAL